MIQTKLFTYQDLQKRAEKMQREKHPEMQDRVWRWLDEQRRKLPKMEVVPNAPPES